MPTITDNGRTVTLTDGDDSYVAGNGIVNLIYGLGGNDHITGGTAGGTIYGGDGDDVLTGGTTDGSASTVLVGGLGANSYANGVAALNGNAGDYTYYQANGVTYLYADNGSGDQLLSFNVPTVVFQDGTTVNAGDLSHVVAAAGSGAGVTIDAAPVGYNEYTGGVGSNDTLVLNGNADDYTLDRVSGFDGQGELHIQGDFELSAVNGSGRFEVGQDIDFIRFKDGETVALKDLPGVVAGDAGLGFGGNADDLLFQTHVSGYQFFSGGGGSDTLYLNGNVADYTQHAITAVSPYETGYRLIAGGDSYQGVALTATNGSGELLVDGSVETVVFRNGQHVAFADLATLLAPGNGNGNGDVLHFVPEQVPGATLGGLEFDGTDAPDRLLLNGDADDYTLTRGSRGEFVLTPHGLAGPDGLVDTVDQSIDTVQFANGQYLALHDLPFYVSGDATFTSGTLGDDTLNVPFGGDSYVFGSDGVDDLYLHGNTRDYALQAVTLAATDAHPAITGVELVATNGSGNIYIDQSTETVHFQDGQYLAFHDLPAYIADFHG